MKFPADLKCGFEDFARSGWKNVVSDAKRPGYRYMSDALVAAATKTLEEGRVAEGKVLWLLGDACSMALKPGSVTQPFEPSIVFMGSRSAIPEDFSEEDVAFFSIIVEGIDNLWLQGRIADLLWLIHKPRDPKYPLLAIDAYRAIPLSFETFLAGSLLCWERAVCLAKMLRAGAGERLKDIETEFCDAIDKSSEKDGVFCLKLADIMARHSLGDKRRRDIASKMESIAKEAETKSEYSLARQYFDAATGWFQKAKDTLKSAELVVESAETFVKEASARLVSKSPSYLVAADFYEDAIQKLRQIPRALRTQLKVDERIAGLHVLLTEAGERSVEEFRVVASGPIDISRVISTSTAAVQGKELFDAFAAFSNIYPPGISKKSVQDLAEIVLSESILHSLFAGSQVSREGRVIGKIAASGSLNKADETLWAEMVKQHGHQIRLLVHGCIWPALEILRLEHRVNEEVFVALAANSPIVPPGRANLFGKALFAGYDGDFVSALHLLVPQIENLVRWHLKARGVKTTNLDIDGIENENGLSSLAEIPEVEGIFGEDFAFELRALFCDPFGPNLRNEVAHGLLTSDACESEFSVYAWWFGLRIVFRTFLSRKREAEAKKRELESQASKKLHPVKMHRSQKRSTAFKKLV